MVEAYRLNSSACMRYPFLAFLAAVGSVLRHGDPLSIYKGYYVVVKVCEFGVLARKVLPRQAGNVIWFEYDTSDTSELELLFLHDAKLWAAMLVKGKSSLSLAKDINGEGAQQCRFINGISAPEKPELLPKFAAR